MIMSCCKVNCCNSNSSQSVASEQHTERQLNAMRMRVRVRAHVQLLFSLRNRIAIYRINCRSCINNKQFCNGGYALGTTNASLVSLLIPVIICILDIDLTVYIHTCRYLQCIFSDYLSGVGLAVFWQA